ncbi:MAG: hypothetical protein Q8S19_00835, partial [Bacillota bacterium]|nr:hypothetical protein [Bacillota bacterium]
MKSTIKAASLGSLLTACGQLAHKYRIFAPTSEDEVTGFRPLDQMTPQQRQDIGPIAFANKPTVGSIKSFFFPDSEVYIKFTRQGRHVEQEEQEAMSPQIILGAKPCDIKSIELIDKVFLAEPVDSLYQEKRGKTIIIATTCSEPGQNCTCREFGISPVASSADLVMLQGSQDEVSLTAQSAKGEQLLRELLPLGSFTVDDPSPLPLGGPYARQLSSEQIQSRMDELFNSPLWDKLALTCLGCGTCTFYCPTCHCFDI